MLAAFAAAARQNIASRACFHSLAKAVNLALLPLFWLVSAFHVVLYLLLTKYSLLPAVSTSLLPQCRGAHCAPLHWGNKDDR